LSPCNAGNAASAGGRELYKSHPLVKWLYIPYRLVK
jgi:hypothetical protein